MNIALVAHDNCKKDLVRWAREHVNELKGHRLTCTGTTEGKGHTGSLRSTLLLAKKETPHRESPLRRLTGSPAARAVPGKGQR